MKLGKDLVAASAVPLVLSILQEGESYGYAIIQRVRELSGGQMKWTDGMLYPVLHRLEAQGAITARWKTADSGRGRKYYSIKQQGRKTLEEHKAQWNLVQGRIGIDLEVAMFDLDQHIQSWRQVDAASIMDSALLDELESHLRDEFDRLTRTGQPPATAWARAVQSLGSAKGISEEFAKPTQAFWLPVRIVIPFLALFIGLITWFIVVRCIRGSFGPLLAIHVVSITAGYGGVFAIGSLGICAVLIRAAGRWSEHRDAIFRAASAWLALFAAIATLAGCVLGAWWSAKNLGCWWSWDPREIGGACVLAWSIVLWQAFHAGNAPIQLRACIAVMANLIVATSWFGPSLETSRHAFNFFPSTIGMLLGGFLVLQVSIVYLGLLPEGCLQRSNRAMT